MTGVNKFWSPLPEMISVLGLLPEVDLCFITMGNYSCSRYLCMPWSNVVNEYQL